MNAGDLRRALEHVSATTPIRVEVEVGDETVFLRLGSATVVHGDAEQDDILYLATE